MSEESTKNQLILRDILAIDRTKLANYRTLLSMVRTALYFEVMGLSVLSLKALDEIKVFAPLLFLIGLLIAIIGIVNYRKMQSKINASYK